MPTMSVRHGASMPLMLLLASFFISVPASGDDIEYVPVYHPELSILRASGTIEIDAELEDAGWRGAAKAGNFAEHNPGDQTKPDVETEVWITYDDQYLYIAWLCYDEPGEVRASFCERDRIFSDDYVILCLDTYGEATHAYEISANPYGIPGDLLFSTAYGEDITYDMIFESAGKVTDFGWVVEMAIPFESIRFPDQQEQVWRVDFWRNRPRESRYQYSWAAYNRDEDCWPCQWGTVNGISGVKPGAGFELLPAVVAHQSGSLDDDGHFADGDVKGDLSLGIAYDISSELTTEATINPDFSQVEADVAQIDVNSTFALFYPEKRPFFQEGSDLFNTYFGAIYTRSINDPTVAGKLTWRKGSSSVAFLSARDEHSVIILPFEESSEFVENGKSYSNVLRVRHDLGEQSHIGLVATDRRFDSGGSGSLVGIDGRIRLSQSNAVTFQFLGTHTEEVDNLSLADSSFNVQLFDDGKHTAGLDGEAFYGHGFFVDLDRNTGNYWGSMQYAEMSPTFRADNGFEPSNNVRYGTVDIGGIVRFEDNDILENINGSVDAAREWNFNGVKKDEWVNGGVEVKFRTAQTGIHVNYLRSNELFHDIQFNDIWEAHTCLSTQPSGALRFGGNINYGHRIARDSLAMGEQTSYGLWADVKPIDRLLLSVQYNHIRSDRMDTGSRLFSQSLLWSRLSLQLSRELSMRLVLQYNDHYDTWDADPLLTYRINSLTLFYIGSTHDYHDMNMVDDGRDGWTLTERQYFMKIQYLFQL
jgi:hypothetical protein